MTPLPSQGRGRGRGPVSEPLRSPEQLAPLLEARRLGLLTDCDGTIAPIAVRPEAARVSPVALEALATLAGMLPVVGAISGRALLDLRAMVGLPELLYIGSHGLTWWYHDRDDVPEEALPYVAMVAEACRELDPLSQMPGVRFEDKGVGLAIHYRQTADPEGAHAQIIEELLKAECSKRFEIRQAIMVVELHPPLGVTKGTALRRVVEIFDLDAILFLGDDLTDVDAMTAASLLREERGIQAVSIAVEHAQAPPLAAAAADYTIQDVAGSETVLEWLAENVTRRETELNRKDA